MKIKRFDELDEAKKTEKVYDLELLATGTREEIIKNLRDLVSEMTGCESFDEDCFENDILSRVVINEN